MKTHKAIRVVVRLTLGTAGLAILFVGIGMLPGRVEGIYPGMGYGCMCDSIHFMQFRDGKVILYGSNHPPASLYGRYEAKADGSVNVFMLPYKEGESEELIFTATPRLWFTRFRSATSTSAGWYRKAPVSGTVRTTIIDQEVSSLMIKKDRTVVKTFYDPALAELRTEMKKLKTKEAEQAVAPNDR